MTVKDFFDSKEKLAIHCENKEQAKALLKTFDRNGYKWHSGRKYTDETHWDFYKEETCYNNEYEYADREYYQRIDFKIIEFEDIEI